MNQTEHLLTCLIEECAEIQQAVCKALRFGLDDGSPDHIPFTTNAQDIAKECCDIIAVIELLEETEVIEKTGTITAIKQKKAKIHRYMDYAVERGTLRKEAGNE